MNYCPYCGTALVNGAKFCYNCGKSLESIKEKQRAEKAPAKSLQELLNTLSCRLKTVGIIWLVVASLQIIGGLFGYWFVFTVGIFNVVSAITYIRNSKLILSNPCGIVNNYTPIISHLIVLIYNLIFGGVIGVIASVFYLFFVRGFVMENKERFLKLEEEYQNNAHAEEPTKITKNVNITLTDEEAAIGIQKEVFVEGLKNPLKVRFPKNIKDGTKFAVRNIKSPNENGKNLNIDVHFQVTVKK